MRRHALFLLTLAACGTSEHRSITGTLVDASGSPIAGATIEAEAYWTGSCDGGHCDLAIVECGESAADGSFTIDVFAHSEFNQLTYSGTTLYVAAPGFEIRGDCEEGVACVLEPCPGPEDCAAGFECTPAEYEG